MPGSRKEVSYTSHGATYWCTGLSAEKLAAAVQDAQRKAKSNSAEWGALLGVPITLPVDAVDEAAAAKQRRREVAEAKKRADLEMRQRLSRLKKGSSVSVQWKGGENVIGRVMEAPQMVTPTRDVGVRIEYERDGENYVCCEPLGNMHWEETCRG